MMVVEDDVPFWGCFHIFPIFRHELFSVSGSVYNSTFVSGCVDFRPCLGLDNLHVNSEMPEFPESHVGYTLPKVTWRPQIMISNKDLFFLLLMVQKFQTTT